tara:strand:- start:267 stop:500 length:234 start_codon:yes stop_codon:yes gene_type:complete
MSLFVEAIFFGLSVVAVGSLISFLISLMGDSTKSACKNWNKNHVMEIALFLTGFVLHITCEYTGLNRWYCKNGVACK